MRLKNSGPKTQEGNSHAGFSLVELCVVVAIIITTAAMAIPLVKSTISGYRLTAGVTAVSGAVQATRYLAISNGYPYRVSFSKSTMKYQVSTCGTAFDPTTGPSASSTCTYSNTGSALPFATSPVTFGADTVLQFSPAGKVSLVSGGTSSSPIQMTLSSDSKTKTLTISTFGGVAVK